MGELLGVSPASLRRSRPDLRALEVFFKCSLNSFQADAVPIADLRPPPHLETNSYACREVKIAAPAYVLARLGNLTRLDSIAISLTTEVTP
jgi:hypothetical protein